MSDLVKAYYKYQTKLEPIICKSLAIHLAMGALLVTLSGCVKSHENGANVIGNMNGVAINMPYAYEDYLPQYSGESRWAPLSNPPIRTYDTAMDDFNIEAKYPSMQHKYENNNLDSYFESHDSGGHSFDWLNIEVQSQYENLSDEQINEAEEYRKAHGGGLKWQIQKVTAPDYVTPELHLKYETNFDPFLKLNHARSVGVNASKMHVENVDYYWAGELEGTNKVTTVIQCLNGHHVTKLSDMCTQKYELPQLHADVSVYYHREHLPDWNDIQEKSEKLILSFKHKTTSVQGAK